MKKGAAPAVEKEFGLDERSRAGVEGQRSFHSFSIYLDNDKALRDVEEAAPGHRMVKKCL